MIINISDYYLALDGDDVGHHLEYYMLTNDLSALRAFSLGFASSLRQLKEKLEMELNADVVFVGGDNLLAKIPTSSFDIVALQNIQKNFLRESNISVSFGIGRSPRESYIALNFAKVSGKNCIKLFQELSDE